MLICIFVIPHALLPQLYDSHAGEVRPTRRIHSVNSLGPGARGLAQWGPSSVVALARLLLEQIISQRIDDPQPLGVCGPSPPESTHPGDLAPRQMGS